MPSTDAEIRVTHRGPPQDRTWVLTAQQWLPRRVDEIWPFFADAHNLEALTPSILNFNVLTPRPIEMRAGAIIDYRLRVRGVPLRWRTEIERWDPPSGPSDTAAFVDNQIKGPYARWNHLHTFEPREGGTLCGDRVEYRVPGWVLSPLINAVAVQRDVEGIFRFRAAQLAEMFAEAEQSRTY